MYARGTHLALLALALTTAAWGIVVSGASARGVSTPVLSTGAFDRTVFYRNTAGQLSTYSFTATTSTPNGYGYSGAVTSDPAVVRASNGDRFVFYRAANGQLGQWRLYANGIDRSQADSGYAGSVVGNPTAVVGANDMRYVYYRTSNGQLGVWWWSADGSQWSNTTVGTGGTVGGDPNAIVAPNGDRYVYFRTPSGQLGVWWFSANGSDLNYAALGNAGAVAGNPVPIYTPNGDRYVYYRASNGQLGIWWFSHNGTSWNSSAVGYAGAILDDPAPIATPGGDQYVYYRAANGQLGAWWFSSNGTDLNNAASGYAGSVMGSPSATITTDGSRYVYYANGSGQLEGWWFGATSGWSNGQAGPTGDLPVIADQYTTSWDFGGVNARVDTSDEASAVASKFASISADSSASAFYNALLPSDRGGVDTQLRSTMADGNLYRDVTDAGGPVWRIWRGHRNLVPSAAVAADLGFDWANARRATSGALTLVGAPGLAYPSRGGFLDASANCNNTGAAFNASSQVGLAISRPNDVLADPTIRSVFYGLVTCFRQMSSSPILLRTQLPIDVARRDLTQLDALAQLVNETGATSVITFRGISSNTLKDCGLPGGGSTEVSSAGPTTTARDSGFAGALGKCDYPTPNLYNDMLSESRGVIETRISSPVYGAWNEPNHYGFSLRLGRPASTADSAAWGSNYAGKYWSKLQAQVGVARAIAGDFASSSSTSLNAMRSNFIAGAGTTAGAPWAIHPYGDFAQGVNINATSSMTNTFFGSTSTTWLTEVSTRLDGQPISGDATGQFNSGANLRSRLAKSTVATKVALYQLVPAAYSGTANDTFDSALADRAGRARPIVCGLGNLPIATCTGTTTTQNSQVQ